MICNQCKKEVNTDSWKFCPHCGSGLKDEKILLLLRKIFYSKENFFLFILAFFLIVGTISFLLIKSHIQLDKKNKQISELIKKIEDVQIEIRAKEKIMPITYYGDNKKMAELRISSQIFGKIRAEIEVDGITKPESQIIDIKPESKIYYLEPEISEKGFQNLSDSKQAELSVKIYLLKDSEEKKLIEEKKPIFFYSRNDISWKEKGGSDNSKYIVRWVDKDREEIKELVRKASDHIKELGGESNSMNGSFGSKEELKRQLEAIFLAVSEDYEVHYIMAPFSYDDSNVQKIKSPEEVLRTKSGLCIELSLLIAAALENVGLDSVIALVPGHAWVGLETGPKSKDYIFIETTALDKSPREALSLAKKNWEKYKESGELRLINVNEMRAEGLLPIKY